MILSPRAFDARKIPGGAVWLDASDPAAMFQLSSGSTAVAAASDPVGYVANKFGGPNALQATDTRRPLWKPGIRNGRGVLRFDGSNDTLVSASLTLDATITVFVVAQFNSAGAFNNATGNLFIEHSANSNNNDGFFVSGSSNAPNNVRRLAASPTFRWAQQGVSTWLGTAWTVSEFRFSAGSTVDATLLYRKNGTTQSNGVATQSVGTVTSGRNTTADLFIFSRNQSSVFSNGDLGELLIWNRPLTDAEMRYVRLGLAGKWSIPVVA